MCEVRSTETGDFIGWRCVVTLPAPFRLTNSWQKSYECLMRALLGNRTFPFALVANCAPDYRYTIFTTSLISYKSAIVCVYSWESVHIYIHKYVKKTKKHIVGDKLLKPAHFTAITLLLWRMRKLFQLKGPLPSFYCQEDHTSHLYVSVASTADFVIHTHTHHRRP